MKNNIVSFKTFKQKHKLGDSVTSFVLWKVNTIANGTGLIGYRSQKVVQGIIDSLYKSLKCNPDLVPLVSWKKHPHHLMIFENGFKIYFRPSGYDGEAYRGVHVKTFAIKYEDWSAEDKKTMVEFRRTADTGCVIKYITY